MSEDTNVNGEEVAKATPLEEAIEEVTAEAIIDEPVTNAPETEQPPVIKLGIKEVKEILDFAIALGIGVEKSLSDDKITLTDLPNFMSAFMKLIPAMTNLEEAKLELMAAGPEEVEELKVYIKEYMDLEDDKLEDLISVSLAIIFDIWMLVSKFFVPKH